VAASMSETDWDDYDSIQMFPGCDCGHDATEHKACWGDWRDFTGCGLCACEVEWEHS
jgi:hypothetical protein